MFLRFHKLSDGDKECESVANEIIYEIRKEFSEKF